MYTFTFHKNRRINLILKNLHSGGNREKQRRQRGTKLIPAKAAKVKPFKVIVAPEEQRLVPKGVHHAHG